MTIPLIEFRGLDSYGYPMTCIVSLEGDKAIARYATPYVLPSGGADAITKADILGEPNPRVSFVWINGRTLEFYFHFLIPDEVFFIKWHTREY